VKKLIALLVVFPIAAFAQGAGPAKAGAAGPGRGFGPGRGDPERMEKRAQLALTLGLSVALDLDQAQALKLGDVVGKSIERRIALHKQMHDAHLTLGKAAQGEKVSAAEVDQAIQKALDTRAQMQVLDRELVAAVTKDLTPEKKARAVLFLERFQRRFGPGMGPGMHGPMGQGMRGGPRAGMGPGMMGPGMGPGMMGPGADAMAGACPGCNWDED
jgi:hypothetical protein